MSVAIVLPARLASTRLPNKLLLDRSGKTLLEHTIERAQLAQKAYPKLFTTIRVACDDEKLVAAAKRAGADAVMTRKDHQSGTDRIAEAAKDLKEEIIVNLQADEPEINPLHIEQAACALTVPAGKNFPMATLYSWILDRALLDNPNVVKVVLSGDRALYFSRAPVPFSRDGSPLDRIPEKDREYTIYGYHHIGMYSYRRDCLYSLIKMPPSPLEKTERLEQLRALENGFSIRAICAYGPHSPGIDTPEDYEAFLVRQRNRK